ncbi:MAG: ROK family protein, partial [Rikenellaceae bacterium]|nr:ROK family protein [Rikenellaceae bacterium]
MKKLAIGIDIGGTNTAFGLVDENGDIFAESVISTERYKYFSDYPQYITALCEAMHALCNSVSFEFDLIGIGIGAPNANYHTGEIVTPANLWKFAPDESDPREERRVFHIAEDIAA